MFYYDSFIIVIEYDTKIIYLNILNHFVDIRQRIRQYYIVLYRLICNLLHYALKQMLCIVLINPNNDVQYYWIVFKISLSNWFIYCLFWIIFKIIKLFWINIVSFKKKYIFQKFKMKSWKLKNIKQVFLNYFTFGKIKKCATYFRNV